MNKAMEFLRHSKYAEAKIISTHVWFYYFMPRPVPNETILWFNSEIPAQCAPGTIFLWGEGLCRIIRTFQARVESPRDSEDMGKSGPCSALSAGINLSIYKAVAELY